MSEPLLPPKSPPVRTARWEAVALAVVGVGAVSGVLWWAGQAPPPTTPRIAPTAIGPGAGAYAGAGSCRECHPAEAARHGRSGHARTLRRAADRQLAHDLDGTTVADPEVTGVTWTYALRDGRFSVELAEGDAVERLLIEYALGSGHHATTFVTVTNPDPERLASRENRLTYFARSGSMGVTPGQRLAAPEPGTTPRGRDLDSTLTYKCFDCHATLTSGSGRAELDVATMIPDVSCERCHGPGRAHVEAARRGDDDLTLPFGPGRWTAPEQMTLCGHCHRLAHMAPAGEIYPGNPKLARFQPLSLMQSRCYTESGGALSCTTCHDAHARASTDRAGYEAACLSCHEGPAQTACTVSPRSGCVDCHMPRVDAVQGIVFTDHWVRARPGQDRASP